MLDFEQNSECQLLGHDGLVLQGSLAFLSFCTLIVKRFKERPRRSWKVWILDITKQLFAAGIAHTLNLALAIWLSTSVSESSGDSCVWYFITIIFDTTMGVLFSCLMLVAIEKYLDRIQYTKLKSGNYFKVTPNLDPATNEHKPVIVVIDFCAWIMQLILWLAIVIIAKMMLAYIQSYFAHFFVTLTAGLFNLLSLSAYTKLIMVTVFIPVIGNSFQFWISDNFLKKTDFNENQDYILRGTFFDEDLLEESQKLVSEDFHNSSDIFSNKNSVTLELESRNNFTNSLK